MSRGMKELEGHTVGATDRDIGEVKHFYPDATTWHHGRSSVWPMP